MKHKLKTTIFALITIATAAAATTETQSFPAPEVVSTLAAVALTTPAFGYLIIKRKNHA